MRKDMISGFKSIPRLHIFSRNWPQISLPVFADLKHDKDMISGFKSVSGLQIFSIIWPQISLAVFADKNTHFTPMLDL